jgi:serine/threonine protein kinase
LAGVLRGGSGRLPPPQTAALGLQLLAALRAVHAAGVVHCDVKPANLLLGEDGRLVLVDFDIAEAVRGDPAHPTRRNGHIIGSPAYMAPELVRGEAAWPPGGLWSLGATLYTAVESRLPFPQTGAVPDTRRSAARPAATGPTRRPSSAAPGASAEPVPYFDEGNRDDNPVRRPWPRPNGCGRSTSQNGPRPGHRRSLRASARTGHDQFWSALRVSGRWMLDPGRGTPRQLEHDCDLGPGQPGGERLDGAPQALQRHDRHPDRLAAHAGHRPDQQDQRSDSE